MYVVAEIKHDRQADGTVLLCHRGSLVVSGRVQACGLHEDGDKPRGHAPLGRYRVGKQVSPWPWKRSALWGSLPPARLIPTGEFAKNRVLLLHSGRIEGHVRVDEQMFRMILVNPIYSFWLTDPEAFTRSLGRIKCASLSSN